MHLYQNVRVHPTFEIWRTPGCSLSTPAAASTSIRTATSTAHAIHWSDQSSRAARAILSMSGSFLKVAYRCSCELGNHSGMEVVSLLTIVFRASQKPLP